MFTTIVPHLVSVLPLAFRQFDVVCSLFVVVVFDFFFLLVVPPHQSQNVSVGHASLPDLGAFFMVARL